MKVQRKIMKPNPTPIVEGEFIRVYEMDKIWVRE